MGRTSRFSAVAAGALLGACVAEIVPGTAIAGEFETNARRCWDGAAPHGGYYKLLILLISISNGLYVFSYGMRMEIQCD